jgi:hypothetical protein
MAMVVHMAMVDALRRGSQPRHAAPATSEWVRTAEGFESLVVMSILESEYQTSRPNRI